MTFEPGAVVYADDVSIAYAPDRGRPFDAVSGLSITVLPGELIGVVGESGSGKSTFARTLAGRAARRPGSDVPAIVGGSLTVFGTELRGMGERAARRVTAEVGYLPQQAGDRLDPSLSVIETVTAPLFERDRDFDAREAGRRAAELVDSVQLPLGMLERYPSELSQGQRQRVAIARSLILEPRLWVADEPTGGVDVMVRAPVLDLVLETQRARDFTALIVSHDVAVMAQRTDRVLVLHRGVRVGLGRVADVLAHPVHPYVEGLAHDYVLRTGPIELPKPPETA